MNCDWGRDQLQLLANCTCSGWQQGLGPSQASFLSGNLPPTRADCSLTLLHLHSGWQRGVSDNAPPLTSHHKWLLVLHCCLHSGWQRGVSVFTCFHCLCCVCFKLW